MNFLTRFDDEYARIEISGNDDDLNDYYVEFIDNLTNNVEYSTLIKVNHWSELPLNNGKNITIKVSLNDNVIFERNKDYKFNRVFILFGSNAIGDTVAWIPYVEEYRRINNVEVTLYTKHNYLFDKAYPDIKFTEISNPNLIFDVDKKFRIDYGPELYRVDGVSDPEGWYVENKKYDNFIGYYDYRQHSLQSIAALLLGLENKEIVPRINIPDTGPKIHGKYVVIAMQSTAQLKYWNNPFGWERLIDFFGRNGYKVVLIDKHKKFGVPGYFNQLPKAKNLIDKTGNFPLSERITDIKHADMLITISSGLAWISWAVGTPVVMISGFTKPWNEFQHNCARVHNPNVCNGCWNDPDVTYDATSWLFCPKKQDFICTKAILPKDVTDAVKRFMK